MIVSSSIGQHLLQNLVRTANYNMLRFAFCQHASWHFIQVSASWLLLTWQTNNFCLVTKITLYYITVLHSSLHYNRTLVHKLNCVSTTVLKEQSFKNMICTQNKKTIMSLLQISVTYAALWVWCVSWPPANSCWTPTKNHCAKAYFIHICVTYEMCFFIHSYL